MAEMCCSSSNFADCAAIQGDFNQSECKCSTATPIVVDVNGNGFQLSGFENGVQFDLTSTGRPQQMAWTAAESDDAFLVLDRNENGTVDGGTELFGNYTPTPTGPKLNGFEALATFDGNHDGVIDTDDPVFMELQLWTDRNHNGISESSELVRLADTEIVSLSVDYKASHRRDRFGNLFRYRARVTGGEAPYAYDVFLVLTGDTEANARQHQHR
jgi:hypothetical protein